MTQSEIAHFQPIDVFYSSWRLIQQTQKAVGQDQVVGVEEEVEDPAAARQKRKSSLVHLSKKKITVKKKPFH